ncbi:enhanced intracellular survival protein Eis [Intrasporangium sp. YIM S08009]|uniref:GNAT family N-acetyltransferase n=1 Tax=Intrasporangium zincisolvens TaxID=3080018 RepID=UPI002B05CBC8|nr:GNAT family N-acetyltransferase [Intrasporangium sp. YIM S08009]
MTDLRTRDAMHDDLPAILRIRSRSFGPLGSGGADWWDRVAAETLGGRMVVVTDDAGTVVGSGRIRPFEQAWGGRHLQMGGVAGVYVEPSARGRGVATTLTRALVTRMGELGDVVSCLFPTAPTLYRRSGYEIGGVQSRTTFPSHLVRALGSAADGRRVRPATPEDADALTALTRTAQARHAQSGPMVPRAEVFRRMLEQGELITYVAGHDAGSGEPTGFVVYDLSGEAATVEHLVAADPATAAALWGVVGSGSSAVPTVHTYLDPRDPVLLSLAGLPEAQVAQVPWMARVIDLAAAFARRGFAPHTTTTVELDVTDTDAPTNAGRWRLTVDGGSGTATRVAEGPADTSGADASGADASVPAVDARGLAALWCGWTASRLRLAGLLRGGSPDTDAALDAVFASTPYITEYF